MTSPTQIKAALAATTDQRSFIQKLLEGALGWNIPETAEEIGQIAYGWSKEELKTSELDEHFVDGSIWQLQPLTTNQPWGVFLLEFNHDKPFVSGRGMTGPLRKVLRGLVPKRRQQSASKTWRREHLLFICTHKYQHYRLAYFKSPPERQTAAPLAAFGWLSGDNSNRTACEFNLPCLAWPRDDGADAEAWVAKWAEAFDVEKVTKKFYEEYAAAFEEVEGKIKSASGLKEAEELRLFTQTLFNRLMFLRFIERKGWLEFSGRQDYLAALMSAGGIGGKSIYQSRIRPLFFEGLAIEGKQQSKAIGKVPFLNGGLFEPSPADDKVKDVPDKALSPMLGGSGQIGLFYKFNFTVEESTPLDIEVAVDPEMLGKVFEQLVTGRHETGSYYTPKPIVSFMCREALKHYLATMLVGRVSQPVPDRDAIAKFVDDHDAGDLKNGEDVLGALRTVKVCDPACGSGAYLLGMLHELLDLRASLFKTRPVDTASVYHRKLEIIENNLYGVDIDEFAVNIARLRLWLSLAVEYEGDAPPPLPNLDFKIEVGDSLAAPDPQAAFAGQGAFRDDLLDQFWKTKAQFMIAHGAEKQRLHKEVKSLRQDLAIWLRSQAPEGAFDWATEFAEVFQPTAEDGAAKKPGGFDIIVANPPYVRMELIKPLKPMLRRNFATVHDERTDLYVYFYARAHELLRPTGVASFISSNKWLRAGYGEKLRQKLLDSQAFHLVADFEDQPVFESASAYACIFVWEKSSRAQVPTLWAVVSDLQLCYAEGVGKHINRVAERVPATRFGIGKPRLSTASSADRRIAMEKSGRRLSEIVSLIGWGVKTGLNEAFVIDGAKRSELIAKDKRSAHVIKRFVTGNDVRRYQIHARDTYILYLPRGVIIDDFPAVKGHLSSFRDQLESRATQQEWFELQQPQQAYVPFFESPKIVFPDIGKECRFAMDLDGLYTANTAYFIPSADWYVLGVLNSRFVFDLLAEQSAEIRGGYLRFFRQFLEPIPIPHATGDSRGAIAILAERTQKLHTNRRQRVEAFLRECGIEPAQSSSRNPLEQPWLIDAPEFTRRRPSLRDGALRGSLAVYSAAKGETLALTEEIQRLEAEIDARVAALYGL